MTLHLQMALAIMLIVVAFAEADQRVWKDVSGKFTVSAELIGLSDNMVELRKGDGKVVRVPLDHLSAEDQAFAKQHAPSADRPAPPADTAGKRRTWRDTSGEFSVEAELADFSDTEIRLRKPDGTVISVTQDKLSTEDRQYLRQLKKTAGLPDGLAGVERALQQPTSVNFENAPLSEVVLQLTAQHNINIHIDAHSLQGVGVSDKLRITYQGKGQPLETILYDMLSPLKLDYFLLRNEIIMVTSMRDAQRHCIARVYRLMRQPGPRRSTDYDTLIGQIQQQVAADQWDRVGGVGAIERPTSTYPVPSLIISNTYRVHREIETRFSGQIRPVPMPRHSLPIGLKLPDPLWKPCTFAVNDMTLADFATYLGNSFGLSSVIDVPALKDVGLSVDIPISASFTEVRLITALDVILDSLRLVWIAQENGALTITTPENAKKQLIALDYRVGPLISMPNVPVSRSTVDFDSLIEIITSCVLPSTWQEVGGSATVKTKGLDTVTIEQSVHGHLLVSELLDQMRAGLDR